jgi:hypothetical protein
VNTALENIPTYVFHGGTRYDRAKAIARLVHTLPTDAVVGIFYAAIEAIPLEISGVTCRIVSQMAPLGCACCTAQISFRVELVRFLRRERPTRLVIELGDAAHVELVQGQLTGPSFAAVLMLASIINSADAAHPI